MDSASAVICQICFKPRHTAIEYKNKYNKEFVPSYLASNYNP